MPGVLGTIAGQVRLDIRQAVAAYATLRAQNARTMYALRGTGDAAIYAGQHMAVGGAAMVYAFGKVVMAAADFERKMDYFGAVTDTNVSKMRALSKYTLRLAQDTIYSATEIADGLVELGKAGVSAEQIVHGIGRAMANLGAAGDIPLAESGQIITSTIQQFDLAARDAVKVTDLLAGAANASIADITDIGVSLKYVGGVAAASGLTFEDTATAISLLAKAGIRGSTAGTSLRQMIVSLGGATGPAREALREIGVITGENNNKFYTATGRLKPLAQVYQIMQDQLKGYNQKQKLAYLRTIFNNRALSAAAILTRDGAKGFKEMNREMSKVKAADVAAARLDNLSGDIEILRGNIETLMVTAGGPFQETLRGWVRQITKLVQAFAALDPETQKLIMQIIGLGGVALLGMGIFTLFIGVIFRFIVAATRLYQGFSFIAGILRVIAVNLKWAIVLLGTQLAAALGVSLAVLGLIVAVAIAFIAAWVLAYKKIKIFRDAVNWWASAVWDAAKAFAEFIKLLATDPGKAWEQFKNASRQMLDLLIEGFRRIPGLIGKGLAKAGAKISQFTDVAVNYFARLIPRIVGRVQGLIGYLISLFTFDNILTVIGFVVGKIISLFWTMGSMVGTIALKLVTTVMKFFMSLIPKIGYALGFLIGRALGLMLKFMAMMTRVTAQLVAKVIGFIAKLPGRVVSFIKRMVIMAVASMINFAVRLPQLASDAATGIFNFLKALPGRVIGLMVQLFNGAKRIISKLPGMMMRGASALSTGFMNGILGLPSMVSGVLDAVIQAFKDVIQQAFNAAKDFAGGLWSGFKDGLGIASPSHIERAAWQITGVLDEETKKMAKKTADIQRLSKTWARTSFKAGDESFGNTDYSKLARMHASNQKRAGNLAAASSITVRPIDAMRAKASNRDRVVSGELDISPNGKAYLRGVAEEVYGDNESFADSAGRMGGY